MLSAARGPSQPTDGPFQLRRAAGLAYAVAAARPRPRMSFGVLAGSSLRPGRTAAARPCPGWRVHRPRRRAPGTDAAGQRPLRVLLFRQGRAALSTTPSGACRMFSTLWPWWCPTEPTPSPASLPSEPPPRLLPGWASPVRGAPPSRGWWLAARPSRPRRSLPHGECQQRRCSPAADGRGGRLRRAGRRRRDSRNRDPDGVLSSSSSAASVRSRCRRSWRSQPRAPTRRVAAFCSVDGGGPGPLAALVWIVLSSP